MVYDVYLHISLITQLSNWNTTIDNYLIHVLWENDEQERKRFHIYANRYVVTKMTFELVGELCLNQFFWVVQGEQCTVLANYLNAITQVVFKINGIIAQWRPCLLC